MDPSIEFHAKLTLITLAIYSLMFDHNMLHLLIRIAQLVRTLVAEHALTQGCRATFRTAIDKHDKAVVNPGRQRLSHRLFR